MEKKYQVLWIDDKHEELLPFKLQARQNNINLVGYKSLTSGVAELEKNYILYDCILFDAIFLEDDNDDPYSVDLDFLTRAIDIVKQLPKLFEIFVLTGQKELNEDKTFKKFIPKYYRKGNDEDIDRLFQDIKEFADKQEDTQIRKENQEMFSVFSNKYLSVEVEKQVLGLIKSKSPENRSEIKAMLANIRSVHESLINQLENIGVITSIDSKFSSKIRHLSGNKSQDTNFKPKTKQYQNDEIENLQKWIYFTCGKYIHNLKEENYNDYMISKYAVESLKYGLFELLLWFKKTYEENK
jgi:hypothetical protein